MKIKMINLGKQYDRGLWGLRKFDLEVGPGVIGLLGPNGTGKSTLMRMLATITRPNEGTALWNGVDIFRYPDLLRNSIGYLPQDFGIYPHLNAIEFLEYLAAIKGMDGRSAKRRIDELLVLVNLVNAARRPLGSFSSGMKQRVGIAQALLNDPQLLIVDEPTAGLDPEERVRFRSLLSDLSGERIIMFSTHIVSDLEATATEIVILHKGLKLLHAAPEKIIRTLDGKVWQSVVPSDALAALKQKYILSSVIRRQEGIQVRVVSETAPNSEAQPVPANLEDVYLHLVSRNGAKP